MAGLTKKKNAFTLSEILLVLSVIGVVAALTIPTLVQKINDSQYKTAWRKVFSDISQATLLTAANNNGSLKGLASNSDELKNLFLPSLNYIKLCSSANTYGNCWHKMDGSLKYLNGSPANTWTTDSGLILNNGYLLIFAVNDPNCAHNEGGYLDCGHVFVDVNGFALPNVIGKDVFSANIAENIARPRGAGNGTFSPANDCIPTGTGRGCSALYLYQ